MNLENQVSEYCKKIKELLSRGEWAIEDVNNLAKIVPEYGILSELFVGVSKLANDYKINNAWRCISAGINSESAINELYNYTNKPERAFYISDVMKKIILSNSHLASSVLAYILGDIVKEKREFVQDDAILFETLSKMTDFDFRNFVWIMDNCIGDDELGEEYVDFSKIDRCAISSYELTLKLCVNVRLFEMDTSVYWNNAINQGCFYKKTYIADKLREYIEEMKQILSYNKH